MRILKEAIGMRQRGHAVFFAAHFQSQLAYRAKQAGFEVLPTSFRWLDLPLTLASLVRFMRKQRIEVVNTHSSKDAWIGGMAARAAKIPLLRTRHLSTPTRSGINSLLLYKGLSDFVVTTCSEIVPLIEKQAHLPKGRCACVPTGIDADVVYASPSEIETLRHLHGLKEDDFVVGTVCVLRSWKGIADLLQAAKMLSSISCLKWLIVGGGPGLDFYKEYWKKLGGGNQVIFTGHLASPYAAMSTMDVFALLSTANEGISQATLQAAYLKKALVTTPTGGLKEVCIDKITGLCVPLRSPAEVAAAVSQLLQNPQQRQQLGQAACDLVCQHFTWKKTLDEMERIFSQLAHKKRGRSE
jgi:glycosyltransferase involved in cell wall biosynthesis